VLQTANYPALRIIVKTNDVMSIFLFAGNDSCGSKCKSDDEQ